MSQGGLAATFRNAVPMVPVFRCAKTGMTLI